MFVFNSTANYIVKKVIKAYQYLRLHKLREVDNSVHTSQIGQSLSFQRWSHVIANNFSLTNLNGLKLNFVVSHKQKTSYILDTILQSAAVVLYVPTHGMRSLGKLPITTQEDTRKIRGVITRKKGWECFCSYIHFRGPCVV